MKTFRQRIAALAVNFSWRVYGIDLNRIPLEFAIETFYLAKTLVIFYPYIHWPTFKEIDNENDDTSGSLSVVLWGGPFTQSCLQMDKLDNNSSLR